MPVTAHKPHSYRLDEEPSTYGEMAPNGLPGKPTTIHSYSHPQDATTVGKAVRFRMFRTMKRGQLPFLLAFFACVMIFFGALSGIGFSDTTTATSDGHHVNGQLSEERMVMLLEEKHREMKKLENEWAARRRTSKDGAWMKANRDQKAIRRKPLAKTPQEKKAMEQEERLQMQTEEQSIEQDESIPSSEDDGTEVESLQ
ncbi:hypothetical protein QFC24_001250 [Naganishia onofrii]|uniref:Uncharacterized protein n=1 Tax=Naganishia onofrii TaxID=1851511 RepID=A0ACC2XUI0_9TREE|nr:hypothetical protein QFC24_001250 [Naganishia onofrii]